MINRARRLGYYLTESGTAMIRNKALHGFAIFVVALSLFILGFSRYLTSNVNDLISTWSKSLEVRVFLDDNISKSETDALVERFKGNPIVSDVKIVSPEEALKVLSKIAPAFDQASGVIGKNPLPPSLSVRLKAPPDLRKIHEFTRLAAKAGGVNQVIFDWAWVQKLKYYSRFVSFIGWLLFAALGVAAVFTVASITRILALSRKEEIAILNLVGATPAAIRSPFIAGGALMGFWAGALALLLLLGAHLLLRMVEPGNALLLHWVSGAFLSGADQAFIILLGVALGALGGAVSLGFTENWG